MRAIVTCESCQHRQWLARPIERPETLHVICKRCERVLRVAVTADHLASALPASAATVANRRSEVEPGTPLGEWSAPLL